MTSPAARSQPSQPAFTDRQTVTLTSYRYSVAAIDACSGKCNISMSGGRGPIMAVFFKPLYGAALKAKGGVATITGLVRIQNGSVQIIVSGVQ